MSTTVTSVSTSYNPSNRFIAQEIADLDFHFQPALREKRYNAKLIKTSRPGVAFGVMSFTTNRHVIVYEDDKAVGTVLFAEPDVKGLPKGGVIYTPHSQFLPHARGNGYATAIYTWVLQSGFCLISGDTQSKAANMLWYKLGQAWPWFLLEDQYRGPPLYLGDGSEVPRGRLNNEEIRIVLLGKGWTLQKFASRSKMSIGK